MKEKYNITGMGCAACSSKIEKEVAAIKGVAKVEVNLLMDSMVVDYDDKKVSPREIQDVVTAAGYGAELASEGEGKVKNIAEFGERRELGRRFLISLIFALPLMYLAMGHMVGLPVPLAGKASLIGQGVLLLPILAINYKYYVAGFKMLFRRSPNMDSLIAVGTTAAVL